MSGAIHVFVGPSLPAADVLAALPGAAVRPPAAQGDVLRALHERPRAIAIVDGYFELVPAVWHKEIMVALSTGVPVFGAASMGALRAAELHPFGMIGHGRIFEWYRDGVLHDDDEVAVVHGPAEEGFRPLSQALVDLRDVYERACTAGVIDDDACAALVAAAQALPYPERHHRRVVASVGSAGRATGDGRGRADGPGDALAALDDFVAASGPGLKARDAAGLLELLAAADLDDPAWRPPPLRVEPTVFLHRLHNEVHLERASRTSPLPEPSTLLRGLDTHAVLQKKVLTRLLARRLGALLQVPVDDVDLADALARFRALFDLTDDVAFAGWRAAEEVSEAALVEFLTDWVVLEKLHRQHTDDIDRMLADHLRIATARARTDAGAAHDL